MAVFITPLVSEIIFEALKFIITIGLLILAVFIGGKLRKRSDAKKALLEENESLNNKGSDEKLSE